MNRPKICPINLLWEWVSSQAVCRSFILALLGMVIGSQSTSNRWIGPRLGWLSGAAVYARVYLCVCWCMAVRASLICMLLSANNSTSVSLHLLSLIWIWSSLIGITVVLRPWLVGCRVGPYSCEQVFLTSPSNYYQDTAKCNPSGNEHSSWHGKSICSKRWGSVRDVK